jgi:3',5'-cyclic AMP phosphodiesterase CpdA
VKQPSRRCADSKEDPIRASFVVMSDTHFAAPGTGKDGQWWNKMLKTQSPEIADALIRTVRHLSPDFIVHCGDFVDTSDIESFHFGKRIMDQLACPYYITLGNHDTWTAGNRAAIQSLFKHADGRFYYTRELAGLRFFFLDCAYWITKEGEDSEYLDWDLYRRGAYSGIGPSQEELSWLEQQLKTYTQEPIIFALHPPIYSKPAYPVGSLPGGKPVKTHPSPYHHFAPYCVHYQKLMDLIAKAPNAKLVFAGHWHISDLTVSNGVLHCQTGSLIEFPFEIRLVQITNHHLSIKTVGLDDPQFQRSSVVEEWGNQWVAGQPGDRAWEMAL